MICKILIIGLIHCYCHSVLAMLTLQDPSPPIFILQAFTCGISSATPIQLHSPGTCIFIFLNPSLIKIYEIFWVRLVLFCAHNTIYYVASHSSQDKDHSKFMTCQGPSRPGSFLHLSALSCPAFIKSSHTILYPLWTNFNFHIHTTGSLLPKAFTCSLCLLILLSLPEGVSWDVTFSWKPPWVMGGNFSWIMAPAHHKNFVTDSLNVTPDYFLFDTFPVFPRREIMFRFSLIFLIGDPSSSL